MKNYFLKYSLLSLLISISVLSYSQNKVHKKNNKKDSIKISRVEYNSLIVKKKGINSLPNKLKVCETKNNQIDNNIIIKSNNINLNRAQRNTKAKQDSLNSVLKKLNKKKEKLEKEKKNLAKYRDKKKEYDAKKAKLENIIKQDKGLNSIYNKDSTIIDNLKNTLKEKKDTVLANINALKQEDTTITKLSSNIASLKEQITKIDTTVSFQKIQKCKENTAELQKKVKPVKSAITKLYNIELMDLVLKVNNLVNSTSYNTNKINTLKEKCSNQQEAKNKLKNTFIQDSLINKLNNYKALSVAINSARTALNKAYNKNVVNQALSLLNSAQSFNDNQEKNIINLKKLLNNYCKKSKLALSYIYDAQGYIDEGYLDEGKKRLRAKRSSFGQYPFLYREISRKISNSNYRVKIKSCR